MAGIKKTLGGDRIGSEEKMKLWLHDYESSTHDISRIWRSSMAPGVLYPFMAQLVEDGDVCEIDLKALARTIPTVGPLFGSFKLQLELYHAPFRLYNGLLHNNAVKIGLNMAQVKFPKLNVATPKTGTEDAKLNNWVGKSSLLHYMNVRDLPNTKTGIKKYNAVKYLAYYDIIKNYHLNKQENNAYVIGGTQDMTNTGGGTSIGTPINELLYVTTIATQTTPISIEDVVNEKNYQVRFEQEFRYSEKNGVMTDFMYYSAIESQGDRLTPLGIPLSPNTNSVTWMYIPIDNPKSDLTATKAWEILGRVAVQLTNESSTASQNIQLRQLAISGAPVLVDGSVIQPYRKYLAFRMITYNAMNNLAQQGIIAESTIPSVTQVYRTGLWMLPQNYNELFSANNPTINTGIASFPIENLDKARWTILKNCGLGDEVRITGIKTTGDNVINYLPYSAIACNDTPTAQDLQRNQIPMNGLVLKCYLSDIFNNWLDTEVIDGDNGINAITSIAVTDGEFTIDALNLANRVYNVLNRIAISGGTYEDWREAVFGKKVERRCESPMYIGGASGEVTFEEVVSTGAAENDPLGTLAGKGTLSGPLKGGYIRHYCEEAGYIIGIVSLTPRIDYSQGIEWDNELDNFDQLHKPGLDCIGFQNLMASWMHGRIDNNIAIGKQPAWIQYQTAVNEAHGDFADENKAMYMTLNRRFEIENTTGTPEIKDATTYIDPSKFNYAFADAKIDSQNFWIQIGIDFRIRRLMSANQIPNL